MSRIAKRKKNRLSQPRERRRRWLFLATGAALAVAFGMVALSWLSSRAATSPAASLVSLTPSAPTQGTEQGYPPAPVVIENYSDFQCRFCGLFARETLPLLEKEFIATGKVRMVFRQFPILGDESLWAAEAAESAAEQGKFWEYHSLLYSRFVGQQRGAFVPERLKSYARELRLNENQFNLSLDSGKTRGKIQDDLSQGRARGVAGTPTFFVNGTKMNGARSIEDFRRVIQALLKEK